MGKEREREGDIASIRGEGRRFLVVGFFLFWYIADSQKQFVEWFHQGTSRAEEIVCAKALGPEAA